jgi:hypothetical protein
MITEVYFIEGLYLYTGVGSSGRGVLASHKQGSQVPFAEPVHVRKTQQRDASKDVILVVDISSECPGERAKVTDAKETR